MISIIIVTKQLVAALAIHTQLLINNDGSFNFYYRLALILRCLICPYLSPFNNGNNQVYHTSSTASEGSNWIR